MKRVLLSLVLIVLVIGLALAGCAKPAPAPAPTPTPVPVPAPTPTPIPAPVEPIKLVVAMSGASSHFYYRSVYKPWADELEERTEGRVKVTIYHSGALGTMNEAYAMVEKGVTDVSEVLPAVQGGRFPLEDISSLPYMIPVDAKDKNGKLIRETVIEKYLIPVHFKPEEVKIMWTDRFLPKDLLLRDKPVRTADEANGMVMGHPGGKIPTEIIKSAFGAAPETILVPDMYLSQERGLVDATFITPALLESWKLFEVTKYVTDCGDLSPGNFCIWLMNPQKFASLPPDIQKIIDELSPKYRDITMEARIAQEEESIQFSKDKGVEFIPMTPEMDALWYERTKHIADDWAKEMDGRGLPGTEIVNEVKRLTSQ